MITTDAAALARLEVQALQIAVPIYCLLRLWDFETPGEGRKKGSRRSKINASDNHSPSHIVVTKQMTIYGAKSKSFLSRQEYLLATIKHR